MDERIIRYDENGEILSDNVKSFNLFDDKKGYLFKANGVSFRGYNGVKISDVIKSKVELGNLLVMAEHIYRDSNIVCVYINKQYRPANEDDVSVMLDLHPKRARDFINKMVRLGVMARMHKFTNGEQEQYIMLNPLYFNASKYISPTLYMLFKKQLDPHIPPWAKARFNQLLT